MNRISWKPERMDIQIGVTIVLSLLLCRWAGIEALAVTTGALMCVQDSARAVYTVSLIRMAGIFWGGLLGVIIAVIDNFAGEPYLFYLLCGAGAVSNLMLCRRFGLPHIQARVSALTLLLVVMVFEGTDRLTYAVSRFTGSLLGAVIALAVTFVFGRLNKK